MGVFSIVILSVSLVFLIGGLFIGFFKGTARSLWRLIAVAVAIGLTFAFYNVVTGWVIGINVNGKNLLDFLTSQVCQGDLAKVSESIKPIIKIALTVVTWAATLIVALIICLIVFGIISKILMKGPNKGKLLGGLIGLLTGAALAFVSGSMITGVSNSLQQINDIKYNDKGLIEAAGPTYANLGVEKYNSSFISKIYSSGGFLYKMVAKTTIDEKSYTIDGQIEVVRTAVGVANAMNKIKTVDLSSGVNASNAKTIADALRSVDNTNLSKEAQDSLGQLVGSVEELSGADLSKVDLTKINFQKAGDLVEQAAALKNGTVTDSQITELLETAHDSGVTPMLAEANVKINNLPQETKDKIKASLNTTTLTDDEKDALKKMLGIN